MSAYYNENDSFCAAWLRELIKRKLIADGEVDERSIEEVQPEDVRRFTQCHFFAGIGGWSYALRLADWSDDRPVWTGSCPCQPFAAPGKKTAQSDERHLWPTWYRLIRESQPTVIFGEQVEDAIAAGWLDDAFHDLETTAYSCGAAVLPACGVGAPHQRDRVWFVAYRGSADTTGRHKNGGRVGGQLTNAYPIRRQQRDATKGRLTCDGEMATATANSDQTRRKNGQMESRLRTAEVSLDRCAFAEAWQGWNGGFGGFGRMDDGVSSRMAKSVVGGFGNAIVPQVAQEFIRAFLEATES